VLVAGGVGRLGRVRGHARGADVAGALVAVVGGHVGVVGDGGEVARAVALVLLAVARCLRAGGRTSRRVVHAAGTGGAGGALVGVPTAVLFTPQALATQVRVWHSVSEPGHWAAALHCTQEPAALQTEPPFWLQAVFAGTGGCEGAPAVQTSLVHELPSSAGTS